MRTAGDLIVSNACFNFLPETQDEKIALLWELWETSGEENTIIHT